MKKYELVVNKKNRLLKFLQEKVMGYSYSNFLQALRKKDIKLNGNRVNENIYVEPFDVVEIYLPEPKNVLNVFYEDDNIIVFIKPKKIEVVDGEYNICDLYYKQTNKKIFAVHRLDRNTEGLVMFAKSSFVLDKMIQQFKKNNVKKYYLAVVTGEPKQEETLIDYLVKFDNYVKIYKNNEKNAQKIVTKYNLIKKYEDISLLNVEIENGKMHQIRAHLAFYELPILGDEKYGDSKINKLHKQKSQCLLAYKIQFKIDDDNLSYLNKIKFEIDGISHFSKLFHK